MYLIPEAKFIIQKWFLWDFTNSHLITEKHDQFCLYSTCNSIISIIIVKSNKFRLIKLSCLSTNFLFLFYKHNEKIIYTLIKLLANCFNSFKECVMQYTIRIKMSWWCNNLFKETDLSFFHSMKTKFSFSSWE